MLNSDLSFNYLYGYVASDLKLSDYPKDTRNIIPLEASDNSLVDVCLSTGIMTFICRFQFVERVTTQKVLQCLL